MTASVLQSITNEARFNNTGSWNGTLAVAMPSAVTARSSLISFYTVSDFAGTHTDMTALDTRANSYTGYNQQNTNAAGGAASLIALVATNCAAGTTSITSYLSTIGDVEDYQGAYQIEVGGVASTGTVVGSNGRTQNALAPGTGNLTANSITLTSGQVPALIVAMAFNTSAAGAHPLPTVNTGTLLANCFNAGGNLATVSYQRVTSAGTYTPTFNQASAATEDCCAVAVALLEAAATVPAAPTIGLAASGNTQATVAFTANGNGGSAITGFTATSSPGALTGAGSSSPITVTGLTNGTVYSFTVTATNAIGTSAPSAASNSVTPSVIQPIPSGARQTFVNDQYHQF